MTTKPITTALNRLAASDTPRKRANAIKAFAAAVKQLEKQVAEAYPKLRADGTAIVRKKPKGCRCPICKVPMKSFRMLVNHLSDVHEHTLNKCVCGKVYYGSKKRDGDLRLASHLSRVPNLTVHFAEAALAKAAGNL